MQPEDYATKLFPFSSKDWRNKAIFRVDAFGAFSFLPFEKKICRLIDKQSNILFNSHKERNKPTQEQHTHTSIQFSKFLKTFRNDQKEGKIETQLYDSLYQNLALLPARKDLYLKL